jgi:hypothetical protein
MIVVKSEWHQVEKRYGFEFDEDLVAEVYPDFDEDEVAKRYQELVDGEYELESFFEDAWNEDIDIDWDYLDEDDWWTDRKGGYEVTYSSGE